MNGILLKSISIAYLLGVAVINCTPVNAQTVTAVAPDKQCAHLFSHSSPAASAKQKTQILNDLENAQKLLLRKQPDTKEFYENLHQALTKILSVLKQNENKGFVVGKESFKVKNQIFQRQNEEDSNFEHPLLSFKNNNINAAIRIPYFEYSLLFDLNEQLSQALIAKDFYKARKIYEALASSAVLKNARSSFYYFNFELGTVASEN